MEEHLVKSKAKVDATWTLRAHRKNNELCRNCGLNTALNVWLNLGMQNNFNQLFNHLTGSLPTALLLTALVMVI